MYQMTASAGDGWLTVTFPYNGELVKRIKSKCPGSTWTGESWRIRERFADDVKVWLEEFFSPGNQVEYKVCWENLCRANPSVDGVHLMRISRDSWSWGGKLDFAPIYEGLKSGGSRANPGVYGFLTVVVKARRGAVFSPEPDTIMEVI